MSCSLQEDCYDVHYYPNDLKCAFVMNNPESCGSRETFISYTPYIYCFGILSSSLQSISVIIFMVRSYLYGCRMSPYSANISQLIFCIFNTKKIFLLVALFLLIGLIAERFLFPVVNIVANRMGLSESLAGTTLIAIGSGLPAIFAIFLDDFSEIMESLVEEVLGSTAFNVSVVPACIVILKPFRVTSRQYYRDTIFLAISVCLFAIFISDRKFSMAEGIILYSLYIIYLILVIGNHLIQNYKAKSEHN